MRALLEVKVLIALPEHGSRGWRSALLRDLICDVSFSHKLAPA